MTLIQTKRGTRIRRVGIDVFFEDAERGEAILAEYPVLTSRAFLFRALCNGWERLTTQQKNDAVLGLPLNVKPPTT